MPTSFAVYLPSLSEVPGMLDRVAQASRRCAEYAEDAYSAMDHGPGPLRDGTARPHQLLAIPMYAEVLDRGLTNLRRIDPAVLREALADYLESHKTGGGPRE